MPAARSVPLRPPRRCAIEPDHHGEGEAIDDASIPRAPAPGPAATEPSLARLEAALERETALREAAQRRAESLGQDHEDAYERLLVRCRALQDDKLRWSEERVRLVAAGDAQAARIETLGERLAEAEAARERREREHRDALDGQARALGQSHRAEYERLAAAQDGALAASEDRFHEARRELVAAEKSFRIEAHRLSALLALKAAEAENRAAEAAALRDQLALTLASRSWRMGRPFRVLTRVLGRAARAPRRLGRILGPRP